MATQKHTPHGRGYNKSLAYFFHQTDYWTYYAEPQAMHGCLLPDGMLSNGSSTPVLDLWESGQPSDDSSSDGGVEGEGPANRLKPAPACNASLAPFPLPGPATADCVYVLSCTARESPGGELLRHSSACQPSCLHEEEEEERGVHSTIYYFMLTAVCAGDSVDVIRHRYEDELFKETVLGYIKEHDAAEGQ